MQSTTVGRRSGESSSREGRALCGVVAYYYCVFIFSLSASSSFPSSVLPLPVPTSGIAIHSTTAKKGGRDSRLKRERWTVDTSLTASFLRNPPPFPSTHLFSLPPLFPLEEDWHGGCRRPQTPSSANGYFRISPSCLLSPPPFLSSKGRRELSSTRKIASRAESSSTRARLGPEISSS